MSTPLADEPICGYGLATGPLCHEPVVWISEDITLLRKPRRCRRHALPEYEQCASCRQPATRECPEFVGAVRCGEALCESCEHQTGAGHGPRRTPTDVALDELAGVVEMFLRQAADEGRLTIPPGEIQPLSRRIITHLSTHTMLKVLSGLAAPPHDSGD